MTLIPLLFAIAIAPQSRNVDSHDVILEQIERRYSSYAKAALRHDIYDVMNHMTADVIWVERHGKDTKTLDRVEIVQRLQPWIESLDPKGVLRFHVNRMKIVSEDEVRTEIEVQYAPQGAPFPPKDKEKNIWKEELVKVSERWLVKKAEQISPKT